MSAYNETTRAELRAALVRSGLPSSTASEVVDLACHASDQASAALIAVVKSAPSSAISLCVLELVAQLSAARMNGFADRTLEFGKAMNAPQSEAFVSVPR